MPQADETWEADFRALPKPPYQNPTHYRGMVVTKKGKVLAESHVEERPEASDLAALLTQAMQRLATGVAHRPSRLYVRGHHQWRELFTSNIARFVDDKLTVIVLTNLASADPRLIGNGVARLYLPAMTGNGAEGMEELIRHFQQ